MLRNEHTNVWHAGWKPSITLEELKLPYNVHQISLSKNEQKQVDYACLVIS